MERREQQVKTRNHMEPCRWAEYICFLCIVIFNLSSWIDLNSVWIELPLIVNTAPEHWTLPSTLSLVISLANVFPVLLVFLRWKAGKNYSEIPFIYIIIAVGIVACFAIGLYWDKTIYVFGIKRSLPLIIAVFALAILDCTSSLVFCDYMRHFKAKYLQAMFLGESLTAALPTVFAALQGVGGETQCILNNRTNIFEPIYSKPRFSVSVFFYLVTGVIAMSLFAFTALRLTSIIQLAKAEDKFHQEIQAEKYEMLVKYGEGLTESRRLSLSKAKPMTVKQFNILQVLNVINSSVLFGCLPTLITYSLLPYGQKAFYYCSILFPLSYPLSSLYAFMRPTLTTFWIVLGSAVGCGICTFIIVAAFQSPCPIWADTTHGGIVMITAWFLSSFILAYVRVASGNRIKIEWHKENGLFYFGLSVQIGVIFGVLPMYLIINVFELLHDRHPCSVYCI